MPTFTEDVEDLGFEFSDGLGPSEYTARLCASLGLADAFNYAILIETSDAFGLSDSSATTVGFNASSGIGLAGVATNTVSTTQNATSGVGVGESNAVGQALSTAETLALAATAAFDVATNATESIGLADVAQPIKIAVQDAESDIVIDGSVVTVVVHNVVDGIGISEQQSFEIDTSVEDSAGFSATGSPSSFVIATASSDVRVTASTSAQLVANGAETDGFALRDVPLPVDLTYPSIWASTERMASALWNQTPFESYAMHDGKLIAAGVDGIYLFEGNLDVAAPVLASVRGDLTDLGSNKKKVFDAALMSGTLSAPVRVTVETEMGRYSYDTHLPSASYPTTHRAPIGRGLAGRFVRFELDNESVGHEGASFSLEDFTAGVADSERVR